MAAILCVTGAWALCWMGDLSAHIRQMWLASGLIFIGYGLGAWCVWQTGASLRLILGCALLMRLALLPTEPSLSDDIYRYLWDGRVQWAGVNPYAHAPDSDAVSHLRDGLWEKINHPHVPTVYPPLAQWLFAGVVGLGGGVMALKLALLLCEVGTIAAIMSLLRQRGRDPAWVLTYAWHPLPLLEIAGSGHVDALGVAALMMSLMWLGQSHRQRAAVGLAAAILAKLIPVMCGIAFWRAWQGRGRWAWLNPLSRAPLVLTCVLVGAAFGYYLLDGTAIFRGLQTYALKWQFNDAVFAVVYHLLRDPQLSWDDAALLLARQICLLMWFGVLVWTLRWPDPVRICFALLGAYILLSPTVHPWYLLWILPFLPLFPRPSWLVWSGLVLLSYEVLIGFGTTGQWAPAPWAAWAQYGPFFILLGADMWRRRRNLPATMERVAASDV